MNRVQMAIDELTDIMHVLDVARRWALAITPHEEDKEALELHLKDIGATRAKLQVSIDEAADARPQDAARLFEQIVRPAMNDCHSLSLPDYRIIQGAVMNALQTAQSQNPGGR